MNEVLITRYIAAWGWHLIAVIFLSKVISFLIVREYVWMMGMVGVVIFAEIMALKRKLEVEDMQNGN